MPSRSGMLGGKSPADSGLTINPSRLLAFSIVRIACLCWDMGLWPSTSPVTTKEAPIEAIFSRAFLSM